MIYLQLLISGLTIVSMWALGAKDIRGWYISLISQGLWLVFVVVTKSWGLLPLNIAMWITCIHGIRKWRNP